MAELGYVKTHNVFFCFSVLFLGYYHSKSYLPLGFRLKMPFMEAKHMSNLSGIARFVVWICSKFTKTEIEQIVVGLSDVLTNRNPEVKPKDDFKEKRPNYRSFIVDPQPPLAEPPEF